MTQAGTEILTSCGHCADGTFLSALSVCLPGHVSPQPTLEASSHQLHEECHVRVHAAHARVPRVPLCVCARARIPSCSHMGHCCVDLALPCIKVKVTQLYLTLQPHEL